MKNRLCALVRPLATFPIAAIMLVLSGCHHLAAPPARVVAFGDSITRGYAVPEGAGWVEIMSVRLQEKPGVPGIPVFNAGGNANTSAEGLRRIESDVLPHLPGLVLVEFGGNDVVHDNKRNVSVDDFEKNLVEIYQRVKSREGETVL